MLARWSLTTKPLNRAANADPPASMASGGAHRDAGTQEHSCAEKKGPHAELVIARAKNPAQLAHGMDPAPIAARQHGAIRATPGLVERLSQNVPAPTIRPVGAAGGQCRSPCLPAALGSRKQNHVAAAAIDSTPAQKTSRQLPGSASSPANQVSAQLAFDRRRITLSGATAPARSILLIDR